MMENQRKKKRNLTIGENFGIYLNSLFILFKRLSMGDERVMNRMKGIIWILISAGGFSMMNLLIPLAGTIPTIQKSFFRNLIAFIIALIILLQVNHKQPIKELQKGEKIPWGLLLLRSIFGTCGVWCNFYAMDHLLISDASVLNKISPFVILIFSYLFLKEPLRKFHLIAILIAFMGIVLIIKPTLSSSEMFPYVVGIFGGIFAGAAYTTIRKLNALGVSPAFIIVIFSGFSCLVSIPQLILNYSKMSLQGIIILVGVGIFAAIGQFGITFAYRFAPATEISVFDYSSILFTGLLGLIFLHQIPDWLSMIGYILIVFAAILTFSYNRKQ